MSTTLALRDHRVTRQTRIGSVALCVSIALLSCELANAADERSAAEIQAEVVRLQQLLAQAQQALAEKSEAVQSDVQADAAVASQPEAVRIADAPAQRESVAGEGASADNRNLETVTVSGERTRAPLAATQDIPASISIVSGESLEALGADSLREITRRAANISRANTSNARNQALVIRGIGRRGTTEAQDPTVGINVDGVPYAYTDLSAWDFLLSPPGATWISRRATTKARLSTFRRRAAAV